VRFTPGYTERGFSRVLGCKIRAWRDFRGFTLAELGASSGISADLLCQVEDGDNTPESAALTQLLSALDVGLYELLTSPGPANRRRTPASVNTAKS